MSEFQYHEFQAIEQPYSRTVQDQFRSLSSRAKVTPRRAIFTYSFSDFRNNPLTLLEQYGDIYFYQANWGSYQLAFRLPRSQVDLAALQAYKADSCLELCLSKNYVILDIQLHPEAGGVDYWMEEDNPCLGNLLPLYHELLAGDYRCLYIAWLAASQVSPDLSEDSVEPPVPPNLQTLTPAQEALVEWLPLDPDLVAAAALASLAQSTAADPVDQWITALSAPQKRQWLQRLAESDTSLGREFRASLREQAGAASNSKLVPGTRTVAQLVQLSKTAAEARKKWEQEAAKAKRQAHLTAIAPQKAALWRRVLKCLDQKKGYAYDEAVTLLVDLWDLAQFEQQELDFRGKMNHLRQAYGRSQALLRRFQAAKLP